MADIFTGVLILVFLLLMLCALRGGSNADDHWDELMKEAKERDDHVH